MIRDALGDGARWDVRIRYVDEGDDLRGTGGAVRLFAGSGLADDAFAVLYGDSYLPVPYAPVWRAYAESGAPALMTVLENADRWDASNARLEPGGLVRYRKGEHDPWAHDPHRLRSVRPRHPHRARPHSP